MNQTIKDFIKTLSTTFYKMNEGKIMGTQIKIKL